MLWFLVPWFSFSRFPQAFCAGIGPIVGCGRYFCVVRMIQTSTGEASFVPPLEVPSDKSIYWKIAWMTFVKWKISIGNATKEMTSSFKCHAWLAANQVSFCSPHESCWLSVVIPRIMVHSKKCVYFLCRYLYYCLVSGLSPIPALRLFIVPNGTCCNFYFYFFSNNSC